MKKKIILIGLTLIFALLVTSRVVTDQGEKPEVSPELKAKIEQFIKDLGADDFQIREAAQKELSEMGERLIEEYRRLKLEIRKQKSEDRTNESEIIKVEIEKLAQDLHKGCESQDPEMEMRANQIRQYLYDQTQLKIAFYSRRGDKSGIYVMDANGKILKRLTEENDHMPAWSPNGTKIAFCSDRNRDGYRGIYVVDAADGKNLRRLREERNIRDAYPTWSPDGTKIAFRSKREGKEYIYVMNADGGNEKRLTEEGDAWLYSSPAWSPDGTKIAFIYLIESTYVIMDADGNNKKKLKLPSITNRDPTWSPDGTKIAFVATGSWFSNLGSKREDWPKGIYVMNADGKNQRLLRRMEYNASHLDWSSDGTKFVFDLDQDGNQEIYVMDADGKNLKNLTQNKAGDWYPTWNPSSLPEISALFRSQD